MCPKEQCQLTFVAPTVAAEKAYRQRPPRGAPGFELMSIPYLLINERSFLPH